MELCSTLSSGIGELMRLYAGDGYIVIETSWMLATRPEELVAEGVSLLMLQKSGSGPLSLPFVSSVVKSYYQSPDSTHETDTRTSKPKGDISGELFAKGKLRKG